MSSCFLLCIGCRSYKYRTRIHVLYTSTSAKAEGSLAFDPSFESQARARLFLAHFPNHRVPLQSTTTSRGLLSEYLGILYDWRQSRFLLCTSRNVYQRDPGHGQTFDLRLVARYRDGPIIVVGLCLCRRVKSLHRRAVRPPLESLAVSGLSKMQVCL